METKRWQQIEEIFHTALDFTGELRSQYLSRICTGDDQMLKEVKSLITAFDEDSAFMDEGAFDDGLKLLGQNAENSLLGQTIGTYKIRQKLGEGGMGDVYLAEDNRLNRQVALKFLNGAFLNDRLAKRQLVREAQAVAMLNHPNNCAVYGIEEIGKHNFIVLEYIEGKTLTDLIKDQYSDMRHLPAMAGQIIEAIAAAHACGIIHRDIKPGNIMVSIGGQVKVLDFGLAKIIRRQNKQGENQISNITHKGLIAGTIAYMSPEQLKGEKLDFRSDIFSIGVILYEMFSGAHPFLRASDAETISAILTCSPPAALNLKTEFRLKINQIIKKCLEKNKELRYQSAIEVLVDFQKIQENKSLQPDYTRILRAGIPLFLLVFLVIFGISVYQRANRIEKLAVLPIINETGNAEIENTSELMTEGLIDRFSNLSKIRVKTLAAVKEYKAADKQLEAARELDVDAVLTGEINRQGEQYVLLTRLTNAADGVQIWEKKDVLLADDNLELQKNISEQVCSSLKPWSAAFDDGNTRTMRQTDNSDAFKNYWKGRYYWKKRDKENIQKAIKEFNSAIAIDPAYARAYAGLADSYVLLNSVAYTSISTREAMTKAESAARDALRLDDTLCESHVSLGLIRYKYYWDRAAAEKEFLRAIELDPNYAPAHYWYSNLLAVSGQFEKAFAEGAKAKDLEPFSPLTDMNIGRVLYYARQFDKADEYLSNSLKSDPENMKARYLLGLVYLQKHRYREAVEIFENIYSTADGKLLAGAALGFTYGKMEKREEALKILAELDREESRDGQIHIPPQERAIIYIGINDKDKAFLWLEKSFEERLASLNALEVEPLFDDVRSDPRFSNLVARIKFSR